MLPFALIMFGFFVFCIVAVVLGAKGAVPNATASMILGIIGLFPAGFLTFLFAGAYFKGKRERSGSTDLGKASLNEVEDAVRVTVARVGRFVWLGISFMLIVPAVAQIFAGEPWWQPLLYGLAAAGAAGMAYWRHRNYRARIARSNANRQDQ